MEKARYNTEPFPNLSQPLNNVKPSNFWGSCHFSGDQEQFYIKTALGPLTMDGSKNNFLNIR